MLLEAFSQTILRWLRIPPGASVRKATGPSTNSTNIDNNDYVMTMVAITVDDICIGDNPLSINFRSDTPEDVILKLKGINDELNDIVKWVATDLCVRGYSIYDVNISKQNKLIVLPYLEEVELYLTKEKKVVAFNPLDKKSLKDKLIFVNYSKSALQIIEDKAVRSDLAFKLNPEPMQLKNADRTIRGIQSAEESLAKYRAQISKIVRVANVDIGSAQGDTQKDVIDTISSAINANSQSLGESYTEFDDNIPVLPNRKGLGKVEIVSDVPSADIKELADVDYWLGKLNLILRFPSSYIDFSQNLDATAVSLIRGDLRYAKLCSSVRTKIVRTLNEFIQSSKFNKWEPVFSLTQLPTSEDDDVISAMDNYIDILENVDNFVLSVDSAEEAYHKLVLLQSLLSTSTNSPALQKWFEEYRSYIQTIFKGPAELKNKLESFEDTQDDLDYRTTSFEDTQDVSEPDNLEGEFLEPQTNES